MFPDSFLTNEVKNIIVEELGMADHQRFLYLLFQGGYLTRDADFGHRIVHTKTDLAKSLSDEALAADLFAKNSIMGGYPVKRGARKAAQQVPDELNNGSEAASSHYPVTDTICQSQVVTAAKPDVGDSDDLVAGLEEADALMVFDLVKALKVTRQCFPRLSRKDFLATFAAGSQFVQ